MAVPLKIGGVLTEIGAETVGAQIGRLEGLLNEHLHNLHQHRSSHINATSKQMNSNTFATEDTA